MSNTLSFDDELGTLYARALVAIARADGEIGPEEGLRLHELIEARSIPAVDPELVLFDPATPEALRYAALQRDPYRSESVAPRALGQALLVDGLELAAVDGEVNSREALLILRFARALSCTAEDIRAATHELDEWLPQLG